MRLLLVHPGASYSTADVYNGYLGALQAQGHILHEYRLDGRIEFWGGVHKRAYQKARREKPDIVKPTPADTLYRAGVEALERALRFNVDGVLIISAMYLHPDVLTLMRRAELKTGVLFTESPYDDEPQAAVAALTDVCWTNERSSLPALQAANPRAYYVPHAYNPALHKHVAEVNPVVPAHDVVFVGSAFEERIELLSRVDWTGIDLALYGEWGGIRKNSRLRQYVKGSVVDNAYAVELYRRARIGLNLYRQSIGWGRGAPRIKHAESLNPRAYELAACGAFQISDYRAEVTEVFGDAVPTFDSPAQLGALVRHFLSDAADTTRAQHAAAARHAVAPHTFAARAAQLMAQLRQAWAEPIVKGA